MTFNPSVPLNSDSPSIFPAQNQTNMGRLQTLLGADHQFNLSAAADDGYHNLIHMTQQAPAGVLAATGRLYVKSVGGRIQLFYMDDTGAEYQISPSMAIRAAVNFVGTGAVGAQVIRSQFNVTSVVKTANGAYTVNFTTAMPDANYIVQATGMRDTSGLSSIGSVRGGVYGSSVTTGSLLVTFSGETSSSSGVSLKDVVMGNIVVFSVL